MNTFSQHARRFMPAFVTRAILTAGITALTLAGTGASTAQAQTALVLNFDDVATNAAGFNTAAFNSYNGFQFEGFGVLTSASTFGTGNNASTPTKFAYGQAFGSSFIYRTDLAFSLTSAYLSFRQLDQNSSPVMIAIRGYRAGDINASFTQNVLLTNSAQQFNFAFTNIEELEFETGMLQTGGRSAVLALDQVAVSVVPEPASIALVATGLVAIVFVGRRRNGRRA